MMTSYRELAIDIETYSSVDLNKYGAYAYAKAPDFEILLIAYKFSDEKEERIIDLLEDDGENHEAFFKALHDPAVLKTAYNANFERTCLGEIYGYMPPNQWRDTMIVAAQMGLPRSLEAVGKAIGLPEDEQKLKTGKALISYFCKPCAPTKSNGGRTRNLPIHAPDKWRLFKEYCIRDVKTEQAILKRLRAYLPDMSEEELWQLDQKINDFGVGIDVDMAKKITEYDAHRVVALIEEAKDITGLDNPNSLEQLKTWLRKQGITVDTLRKDDVEELLNVGQLPYNVRRVLEIRQALGKTSTKKYGAMLGVAGPDNRARGIMRFYGGHTGRWAGRGLQPQNLTKNTMPDDELDIAHDLVKSGDFESLEMLFGEPAPIFSQLVRTGFIPSEGNRFIVSDFSAIEARVLAWIADEPWRLEVFNKGGDIYCASASAMYNCVVEKHGENGHLRQKGKVAELALGYGGGVGALRSMDSSGSLNEDELPGIVEKWRAASPKVVRMWKRCQDAAVAVVGSDKPRTVNVKDLRLKFQTSLCGSSKVLTIWLPNGRPIRYWEPELAEGKFGLEISYMNQNQTTKKWERTKTYGGKLTENIVQSIARDCLADKMKELDHLGYDIAFHVHDELILDAPRDMSAEVVDKVMGQELPWAPGLPLQGSTYECEFYRKD